MDRAVHVVSFLHLRCRASYRTEPAGYQYSQLLVTSLSFSHLQPPQSLNSCPMRSQHQPTGTAPLYRHTAMTAPLPLPPKRNDHLLTIMHSDVILLSIGGVGESSKSPVIQGLLSKQIPNF
jgi:hypothetical protein